MSVTRQCTFNYLIENSPHAVLLFSLSQIDLDRKRRTRAKDTLLLSFFDTMSNRGGLGGFYSGSRLLNPVSDATGLPIDQVDF